MLAGLLTLLLGLMSLWGARYWVRLRRRVRSWPVVRGQVTARQAIQPTDRGLLSVSAFRWAPDVRFTYRVGVADYVGDKIWLPWGWTNSRARVDAFLATIPDDVEVRYDPTHPQTSCLYPPSSWNIFWYGILGVVLFSLGVLLMLVQALGTP